MLVTNRAITAAHPQYPRSQHSLRRAVGAVGSNYRGSYGERCRIWHRKSEQRSSPGCPVTCTTSSTLLAMSRRICRNQAR